jgi:DNA processing protein
MGQGKSPKQLEAQLLLAATPGLARCLHRVHGSVEDPLSLLRPQPAARLAALGLPAAARTWLARPDRARVQSALAWLASAPDHSLVSFGEADYPPLLAQIEDPPPALFVRGNAACLSLPQVAVVGARSASPHGLDTARDFAGALAAGGFAIVSGLAHGIDGAAHDGALLAGGTTTAVLATGPDSVYPRDHADLAGRIAATGALVTEFFPGTPARRRNFPQRNRIISGLSAGTLVVEAATRSGSLITARLAGEQGREVFAIPGSIHNPLTRGCHRLLRDGASLVETPQDVVSALSALLGSLAPTLPVLADASVCRAPSMVIHTARENEEISTNSRALLGFLGYDPVSIDNLVQRAGLTPDRVCSILALLELQGLAHRWPDGRYARTPPGKRPR